MCRWCDALGPICRYVTDPDFAETTTKGVPYVPPYPDDLLDLQKNLQTALLLPLQRMRSSSRGRRARLAPNSATMRETQVLAAPTQRFCPVACNSLQ